MSEDPSRTADAGRSSAASEDAAVPPLWRAVLVYSLIRLGLVVTLTAAIVGVGAAFSIEVPIIVALAFAMVLQLPLAVAFFRGPRNRLTAALARAKSARTAERDRLHEQLTGEHPFD